MSALQRAQQAVVRRPAVTLALLVILAAGGAAAALQLRPSTSTDTFVSASSPAYRATVQAQRRFGSDAVVVLVKADRKSVV